MDRDYSNRKETEIFKDISTKPAGCKEECHYNLKLRVVFNLYFIIQHHDLSNNQAFNYLLH